MNMKRGRCGMQKSMRRLKGKQYWAVSQTDEDLI
jgi:hypothetical protein